MSIFLQREAFLYITRITEEPKTLLKPKIKECYIHF